MRSWISIRADLAGSCALLVLMAVLAGCQSEPAHPVGGLEFAVVVDKAPSVLELDHARADGTKERLLLQQPVHFAVKSAVMAQDPSTGSAEVEFEMEPADAKRFKDWTGEHVEQKVALLVNRRVYTVAKLLVPLEGKGVISGGTDGLSADDVKQILHDLDAAQ